MAGRGRGRGGGVGRGRGGGPVQGPVARDDDGNILPAQVSGPPPLFPTVKQLPPRPILQPKDRLMLNRRRDLLTFWRSSPYYMDATKSKAGATQKFPVEKYSEVQNKKPVKERAPLASVLTLVPEYFPEELYSQKEKRQRIEDQGRTGYFKLQGKKNAMGLGRLEQLMAIEERQQTAEAEGKVKGKEEEEEEDKEDEQPEDALEEEEDDWAEDDDYLQGEHFDDDEGYDDDFDGGDEGALY